MTSIICAVTRQATIGQLPKRAFVHLQRIGKASMSVIGELQSRVDTKQFPRRRNENLADKN